MTAKSCRKIEVLITTDAIFSVLQNTKDPISVTDIARATGLSVDSCFRQIGTMAELRWVEKIGDGYVLGMRLAVIWAKKKAMLESERDTIDKKLTEIGGDH
ncbi:MAG: helix-turn-helix domain-containing protein [Victivallales bacterium]|jgi:DNA-binding IclR family transcriptional regulator